MMLVGRMGSDSVEKDKGGHKGTRVAVVQLVLISASHSQDVVIRCTQKWQCLDSSYECFEKSHMNHELRSQEDEKDNAISPRYLSQYHFQPQ